jgi:SAM-dependent methyltransferase
MLSMVKRTFKRLLPSYRKFHCSLCGHYDREFHSYGLVPRPNALCPGCGSLERHRLVWSFLQRETDLFDRRPKKMLHVAPEPCLSPHLRALPHLDYLTADLFSPTAMVVMDVTDIQYPDNSFDVIYCSHVLEHVLDDRKAMREFFRVLKPGGWAVLMVPIEADVTFEDPSVTDPKERERVFGQEDHVRIYGPDFVDRPREAGFTIRAFRPADLGGEKELAHLAIPATEAPLFYCIKPA